MTFLAALVLAVAQDGEVDRILRDHAERLQRARSEAEERAADFATRAALEAFLRDHPSHPDGPRAAWLVVESYLLEPSPDRALERVDAYLRSNPDAPQAAAARFARGELLLRKEDWAGAREAFDAFLARHPKDERGLFAGLLKAVALQHEGRDDEAAALLRKAHEAHRDRPDAWQALLQLAALHHARERGDEARRALEEVIAANPDPELVEAARRHLTAYLRLPREIPAFAARDLEGRPLGPETLRGKVAIVYFFDSRLAPAVGEAIELRRLREAHPGLVVAGFSMDADRRDVLRLRDELKIDWPLSFDGRAYQGEAAQAFGVARVPSRFVFDKGGRARFYNVQGPDLRRGVEKLLKE